MPKHARPVLKRLKDRERNAKTTENFNNPIQIMEKRLDGTTCGKIQNNNFQTNFLLFFNEPN